MEPTVVAAVPMTFHSPQFYLLVLTIIGVVGIFYLAFTTIAKSSTDNAPYDPARTLTNTSLIMVSLVFVYVAGVVAYQIYTSPDGKASSEAWGQLCLFIGWVLGKAGDIYNARFGNNVESSKKDATIAQMARTSAVTTDALLDPAVTVSGTGSGQSKATITDLAGDGATTTTGTMNVTAQGDVNVTEKDKP